MKIKEQKQDYYFCQQMIKANQRILNGYLKIQNIAESAIIERLQQYRIAKFENNHKLKEFIKEQIKYWKIQLADSETEINHYKSSLKKYNDQLILIS